MSDEKKSRDDLIKQLTSQVATKGAPTKKEAPPLKEPQKEKPKDTGKSEKAPAPVSSPGFARRSPRPVTDYSKERISDRMFAGWKKSLAKENSPVKIEETIQSILDGKKKDFTGYVEVEFEDNNIITINENPVELEEEVRDQVIDKSQFEAVLDYFKNPQNAPPEIAHVAEGLSEDKIQKAIEIGAEHILKKPIIKLDGSIEYNIVASVEDPSV